MGTSLAHKTFLGCHGPGEPPVSGTFRKSGVSKVCSQRPRDIGVLGSVGLWVPVDEILREVSGVRKLWSLT